jgi:hypothetical protein
VAVDKDQVALDQAGGRRAAEIVCASGQKAVQPRCRLRGDQALGRRST